MKQEKQAYTVAEVAALMGFSIPTVITLFEKEPGTIIIKRPETLHKRGYRSIRIPRAVYERDCEEIFSMKMKTMAIIGYILAALAFVSGCVISTNGELPLQGFSAVIVGAVAAFGLALPSTALMGIVQIRGLVQKLSPMSEAKP